MEADREERKKETDTGFASQKARYIQAAMCTMEHQWEPAVQHKELSSVLCDDLEVQDGG